MSAASTDPQVVAKHPDFTQLGGSTNGDVTSTPLDFFLDVPVTVTARLGEKVMPIAEVMKLGPGAVIELDREVSQPVDLVVRGVVFARGEVVVIGEHFAVRIKEVMTPKAKGAK